MRHLDVMHENLVMHNNNFCVLIVPDLGRIGNINNSPHSRKGKLCSVKEEGLKCNFGKSKAESASDMQVNASTSQTDIASVEQCNEHGQNGCHDNQECDLETDCVPLATDHEKQTEDILPQGDIETMKDHSSRITTQRSSCDLDKEDVIMSPESENSKHSAVDESDLQAQVEKIDKIIGGLTRKEAEDIKAAELYVMLGNPQKLVLEYEWVPKKPVDDIVELNTELTNMLRRLVHLAYTEFTDFRRIKNPVVEYFHNILCKSVA